MPALPHRLAVRSARNGAHVWAPANEPQCLGRPAIGLSGAPSRTPHDDQLHGAIGKEAFKPTPGQPMRAHDLPLIIGPSRREDSICQIDGNGRSIHVGLLSFEDLIPTPMSTQTRCGKGRHGAVGNRAPGGSCHNVPVTFTFNRMRALVLVLASLVPLCAVAQKLPRDVARYLEDRRLCDHFRGEPTEGNLPEQVERRSFVNDSLDIYCAGTDTRLAALKRRYAKNKTVMNALKSLDEKIE